MMERGARASRLICVFVATAALAGCAADSPTAPTANQVALASVLAQISAGGMNGVSSAGLIGAPTTVSTRAVTPSACNYSSATQGFVCPTVTNAGLTFDITYYLYDGAGHLQSQFDTTTTSAVRTVTDTKGSIAAPAKSDSGTVLVITDHGDHTLSGLLAAPRVLNGTETTEFDLTTTSATRTSFMPENMSSAMSNVVLSTDTSSPWPKSGTITSNLSTPPPSDPFGVLPPGINTIRTVITFNGTSTPTMTITSHGGPTTTCRIDLSGQTPSVCT